MDPVEGGPTTGPSSFRVFRWWDPPVVGVALLAMAAGFGQFGAVAALGSVAKTFGHVTHGATFADEAGLSGTVLGVGLGIARLASLAGLPLAGLADRFGRRPTLLATCALGLALTIVAAVAPGYWWFVVIFALGRPLLSATQGVTQVSAAELTSSAERAKGVALVAAGYAAGAGLTAIIHSLAGNALGFRGIFALAVVPLMLLPLVARLVVEPGRFVQVAATEHRRPVLGPVDREFRGRLVVVALLAMAFSVITGPANSLVFIYAQNFLHVSGLVTSAMVVGAGVSGLGGLLVGRWLADRWGRRPTVAVSMVGLAAFGTLAYTGSEWALIVGYVLGVTAGGVFAPAGGALANELFPTSVRASVAGWFIAAGVIGAVIGLVVFGAVADVGGVKDHAGFAATVVFLPALLFAVLLVLLPETRGREPEDLWPSSK
jgi:MFS family permease